MRRLLLSLSFAMLLPGLAAAQSTLLEQGEQLLEGLGGSSGGALTGDEMAAGLKEALSEGVKRVVGQVGQADGYNADPEIHIPLPESLETVQKSLKAVGLSGLADDVELKLNRGAEKAAPEAVDVFAESIAAMTWDDAERILNGREDEATRYFQRTMTPELTERFTPIVEESLSEVGAVRSYDEMMGEYDSLPFLPDVKSDLSGHAVEKALEGLFFYLAAEEKKIRENPAARTTELLQRVFGAP